MFSYGTSHFLKQVANMLRSIDYLPANCDGNYCIFLSYEQVPNNSILILNSDVPVINSIMTLFCPKRFLRDSIFQPTFVKIFIFFFMQEYKLDFFYSNRLDLNNGKPAPCLATLCEKK